MPQIKLNGRDMIIEAADPSTLGGTILWKEVAGITSFTLNDEENEETAETTTFSDDGYYNQEKMQLGAQIELEGFRIADSVTGAADPGQALCETWHGLLGPASQSKVRFRHKLQTEWTVWTATNTIGEKGGEVNDKMSWNSTLTRCGKPSTLPVLT